MLTTYKKGQNHVSAELVHIIYVSSFYLEFVPKKCGNVPFKEKKSYG